MGGGAPVVGVHYVAEGDEEGDGEQRAHGQAASLALGGRVVGTM